MFGFLNINKPSGKTSHDIVSILRKVTGIKQIGHAGTLDPLASGVLPIAIGKATKLIDYLPSDKRYVVGLEFGKTSDTFDIEGRVEKLDCKSVSLEQIKSVLPSFRGKIEQVPPAYSAVHYKGKRLYELARTGKIPQDIPSRTIEIYRNEIVDFDERNQRLKLDISCSKGTYIRTIVNDLGLKLNNGAVMFELIRKESAGMKLESAIDLNNDISVELIQEKLINPAKILPLNAFDIDDEEYMLVKNGCQIKNRFEKANNTDILLLKNGILIALAQTTGEYISPKKVMLS